MNSISLISSIAMAVGLAASLPQIVRMLRSRSSAGQSLLGWAMGLVTNLSMAYVNLFGFHAVALMASNVVSAALCVAAMVLITRFGPGVPLDDLAPTPSIVLHGLPSLPVHHGRLIEMPTTEFVALRDAVIAVSDRREQHATGALHLDALAQAA